MFKKFLYIFLIIFFSFNFVFAERNIPKYNNFINDYADIFSQSEENILNTKLKNLEKKTSVEFAILTINTLAGDSLEEYSLDVARSWGVGKKKSDNGLLLLIVKNDKKIRIEVGYGLEGNITDAQSYWLIEKILKPNFRKNNFFVGVNELVDKVSNSLLENDKIPENDKIEKWQKKIKKNFLLFLYIPIFILFYPIFFWIYYRKYKIPNKYPKIIKEPYKNFHPFLTGFLIDKKINISDLMAGIIYLANKGYIEIQKKKKDKFLFDKENFFFNLKVKENEVEDELDKLLIKFVFQSNFTDKIKSHGFYLVKSLESVIHNPDKIRGRVTSLDRWLKKYSKKEGILEKKDFYDYFDPYDSWIKIVVILVLILFFGWLFGIEIFLVLSLWIFIPIVFLDYRYKKKGWEIKYQLESFKRYLEDGVLEENEKTKELFLKYLPYAFAFSVEKDWVKKFDNLDIPDWYKDFELNKNQKELVKDLNKIKKTIAGVGTGGAALFIGNISFNGKTSSFSSGFGGFGGGSFGGGGASGGW